jgi:hypothetical protein
MGFYITKWRSMYRFIIKEALTKLGEAGTKDCKLPRRTDNLSLLRDVLVGSF